MLSREQVKGFYNRLGDKQDSLGFYEAAEVNDLIAHAGLEQAEMVFEFGCGTGRFAQLILEHSDTGIIPTAYTKLVATAASGQFLAVET